MKYSRCFIDSNTGEELEIKGGWGNDNLRINVLLKDGTFLRCVIYENELPGEYPIVNKEIIKSKFEGDFVHENFGHDVIHFQTEMINGHFHPANVLWYEIINE